MSRAKVADLADIALASPLKAEAGFGDDDSDWAVFSPSATKKPADGVFVGGGGLNGHVIYLR